MAPASQVPALLILESFAPLLRRQLLEKAMIHNSVVWILRQHKGNPDDPDLAILNKTARLYAELPKRAWFYTKRTAGRSLHGM
jgi:hypothetical protein